jgi:molybdate transport system ATP-binding protein
VFQDARLFPHLSVRQNLAYGRWFAPRRDRRIDGARVVETLGIGALLDRRPGTLSGGERQRVAFGRALLSEPRLLLMDEPLAALDAARKQEILPLIEMMRDIFGIPIVYVSHSVDEVARLAGQVVALDEGRVVAVGRPADVLSAVPRPEDRFAVVSVLDGLAGAPEPGYGLTPVSHPAGTIWIAGEAPAGHPVHVVVRGTDVAIATARPTDLSVQTVLPGSVAAVHASSGPYAVVDMRLAGGDLLAAVVTRRAVETLRLGPGSQVWALVKAAALGARPDGT